MTGFRILDVAVLDRRTYLSPYGLAPLEATCFIAATELTMPATLQSRMRRDSHKQNAILKCLHITTQTHSCGGHPRERGGSRSTNGYIYPSPDYKWKCLERRQDITFA